MTMMVTRTLALPHRLMGTGYALPGLTPVGKPGQRRVEGEYNRQDGTEEARQG